MQPSVSIVIPVYNVEADLLRKCIKSCLEQAEKNIEVIVVNDCSTDASCDLICREYAHSDNRVVYINKEENEGLSAARNSGVSAATGKWITFVDGDDWIDSKTCDLVNERLVVKNDVDLIFWGQKREYNNTTVDVPFMYEDERLYSSSECRQLQIDVLDYKMRLATAYGKFIKRELLISKNIFHNRAIRCGNEGVEFNLRLFGSIVSAASFARQYYHYMYNEHSITAVPSEKNNQYTLYGLQCMEKYINSLEHNEMLYQMFLTRTLHVVIDAAVGCYFSPKLQLSVKEKINHWNLYVSNSIFAESLKIHLSSNTQTWKKVVLFCIRKKWNYALWLLGLTRYYYFRNK